MILLLYEKKKWVKIDIFMAIEWPSPKAYNPMRKGGSSG
jgi:hypothetical protein